MPIGRSKGEARRELLASIMAAFEGGQRSRYGSKSDLRCSARSGRTAAVPPAWPRLTTRPIRQELECKCEIPRAARECAPTPRSAISCCAVQIQSNRIAASVDMCVGSWTAAMSIILSTWINALRARMGRRRIGQERFGFAVNSGKRSSVDELSKLLTVIGG